MALARTTRGSKTIKDRARASSAAIYQQVRRNIFKGQLRPGTVLPEMWLAQTYECSQATGRQVIFQLERVGLVTRQADRSASVTNLSSAEILERVETRIPLEALAWKEAARRLTSGDFKQLEMLVNQLANANEFETDFRFHATIWYRSGNATLARTLDELITPLCVVINFARRGGLQDPRVRVNSHRRILEMLRRDKTKEFEDAVREHLEGAYGFFPSTFRDCRELVDSVLAK